MEVNNMEKDCVAGFYVKLTSNATAIPLTECELLDMIKLFRRFPRSKASDVLFRFEYGTSKDKKTALGWFAPVKGEFDHTPCFDSPTISKILNFTDEEFKALVQELQIQYQQCDPAFLSIDSIRGTPIECKKELNILQEKLANSPLLFFLAVKFCVKAQKNSAVSQWILELLSTNPASQCEGLKNLGFNFNCRLLLKPFSIEIGTLLLAMHQLYVQHQKLLNSQDSLALPLVNLLKQLVELDRSSTSLEQFHYSDKVDAFESAVVKFIKQSANISNESPTFSTFVEYRNKLETLGNSIVDVLLAEANHKNAFPDEFDGILYVAVTNTALFQNMHMVETALSEARAAYNFAYNDLQDFCTENNLKSR